MYCSTKVLNSIFLPQSSDENNPYQKNLASELKNLQVNVSGLSYRIFFLKDVLRSPKPTVLHLHWLHSFLIRTTYLKSLINSNIFLLQILIIKILGIKIIWTIHNLKNHDNGFLGLERFYTSLIANLCDSIIVHGGSIKDRVVEALKLKNPQKVRVIPHGNYINCYENKINLQQAKQSLNLDINKTTFLFLGLIRPYKGVPELIDAFETINRDNYRLIIAGKIWGEDRNFYHQIIQKTSNKSKITLIPEFIPNDRLQLYFNACDVVVFPYKNILTSGAVLLAMSFGKACIAPKIGCIPDTLDDIGSFLYNPKDRDGLANSLQLAIDNKSRLDRMGKHNFQLAEQLGWDKIAQMTLKVYKNC